MACDSDNFRFPNWTFLNMNNIVCHILYLSSTQCLSLKMYKTCTYYLYLSSWVIVAKILRFVCCNIVFFWRLTKIIRLPLRLTEKPDRKIWCVVGSLGPPYPLILWYITIASLKIVIDEIQRVLFFVPILAWIIKIILPHLDLLKGYFEEWTILKIEFYV